MNCPRRIVKINGKKENIILFEPEALDVVDENFNYVSYVEDLIALRRGIKQGIFADIDDIDLTVFYNNSKGKPKQVNEFKRYLDDKYRKDIIKLQIIFEENLNKCSNIDALNNVITKKMKMTARAYLESFKVINRLMKKPEKLLEEQKVPLQNERKKGNNYVNKLDWRDIPIRKLNRDLLSDNLHNAYRKLILLPNTPENFYEFTVRQLMDMNKEYLSSSKGKCK